MSKKIYFLSFLLALIVSGTGIAFAQTDSQPEVYVRDLILKSATYKAGGTVTGSFTLYNNKSQAVSDVYAEVTLAGDYQKNTLANVFYDSKKMGPYYLQGKESKKIDFTYVLPASVAGNNLGIQVSALLGTGFRMGWKDFMIKVEGKMSILNITKAFVSIGDDKFDLQVGPTIYEGEKVLLEFTLTNPTASLIEVTPKIKVYNQAQPAVSQNVVTSPVKVLANSSSAVKYELPTFDNKAGVYMGEAQFLDAAGVKKAVDFPFRYIIVGDIATINGLTMDKASTTKGDSIKVTLSYSGPVFDIRSSSKKADALYDLNIKLFSEKGKLIAEYAEPMNFNKGTEAVFALKSLVDASAMRAEVTVKKGDTLLAEYKSVLPTGAGQAGTAVNYLELVGYILLGIVILGAVILALIKFKNRVN